VLSLRELQLRFFSVLGTEMARAGDPAGRNCSLVPQDSILLEVVKGSGALGPAERLDIYAGMYRTRLLDVLREDFPRTLAIVGNDTFGALACRYLAASPSTNASVRHLGRSFADFLATQSTTPAFLADLARLEWARVEVFDAADVAPFRLSDLQSVPAEAWPALRFRLIPACVVVESAWPVHRIWADAGETPLTNRHEPEATTVRVWREVWSISHATMGVAERQAFRALERGAPFAGICAAVDTDLGANAAAREVGGILVRWLEDGLLARPDPPVLAPSALDEEESE
jgi:hypothetical protein